MSQASRVLLRASHGQHTPLGAGSGSLSWVGGAPLILLIGVAWLCLLGFGPPTLGTGDPFEPPVGSRELEATAAMPTPPPGVRAVAVAVIDAETGIPITTRNADARLAPASLTKMMTALVALDHARLTDVITATERSRSEPSIIGLDPGDALPLEEMLYGLLVSSGNDAALAIAETVGGGSIERFVDWMNERSAAMGLYNTQFRNPHGLDQEGHYSSARDMAILARALLQHPTLAGIVATGRRLIPGPPAYLFQTTNPLLGAYPGLDGIKTGFTDNAGRCLAASATRDGRRVISVVLNAPDLASETRALLDLAFERARPHTLSTHFAHVSAQRLDAAPGQTALPATGTWGPTVTLTGWELPWLRAAPNAEGPNPSALMLAGRTVVRW